MSHGIRLWRWSCSPAPSPPCNMHALGIALEHRFGGGWTDQVAAIGLTGQLPTLVCLDDAKPLGAAITWKDGRADAGAATPVDAARRMFMYGRTGMPIDGPDLAPMLQFHFAHAH